MELSFKNCKFIENKNNSPYGRITCIYMNYLKTFL